MKKTARKYNAGLSFYRYYLKLLLHGNIYRKQFRYLKFFILFIGYGRSGHTLIASLLNAHPDIILSMEFNILSKLRIRFTKLQIFYLIQKKSEKFQQRSDFRSGYSYALEKGFPAKSSYPKIIGDKKAGASSILLSESANLLEKLAKKVKLQLKLIHVIRNPFDIITTATLKRLKRINSHTKPLAKDLEYSINRFFIQVETINKIKNNEKYKVHDIYFEDFVISPQEKLNEAFSFLELKVEAEFLNKCSESVFKEPRKTRNNILWDEHQILKVEELINKFDFLSRYSFKN